MTYDVYRYIFYGGAGLAVLCLIVALVLFFVLKIGDVIGDLTGATARKAIEQIRSQNENTGSKTYKSSHINRERGKLTDRMTPSGRISRPATSGNGEAMATSKISTQQLDAAARESYETSLLEAGAANETTLLQPEGSGETTVLSQDEQYVPPAEQNAFAIEYEITIVHTNERIA